MREKITGIFPALITPFTKNDEINEKSLRKLIQMNKFVGVDGFYIGGSTSEAFLLSIEERKRILDIADDEIKGEKRIIYHVGSISTNEALELAQHAETKRVDAVSSIPPFFYNFTFQEIESYYIDIVRQIELPMIIYNFPAFSGVSMSSENCLTLFQDPRIIGIKHTSFNLFELESIKRIDKEMTILNGHDEVFLPALSIGADGAIGSTYNFMADKFIKIRNLFTDGAMKEALELQSEANEVIRIISKTGVYQSIKYILSKQGIDCGECRRPFQSLTDDAKKLLDNTIETYLSNGR